MLDGGLDEDGLVAGVDLRRPRNVTWLSAIHQPVAVTIATGVPTRTWAARSIGMLM